MLGDIYLGNIRPFRIIIIIFIPVNEHHHIRILFDAAAIPQIGEHLVELVLAEHRTQRGLRQLADGLEVTFHLDDGLC